MVVLSCIEERENILMNVKISVANLSFLDKNEGLFPGYLSFIISHLHYSFDEQCAR